MKILDDILDGYSGEMAEKLQELVRFKSVLARDDSGTPFGQGVDDAFSYMLSLGKEKGFECIDYDRYAGEMIFGDGVESVGIVTHMDVVPEGDGWDFDPYGGEIHDSKIYGRGAIDNKGPCIASFFASLAIRESGLPIKRKIKQIIGTNEESGTFECIEYYKKHAEIPELGICPDGWFPAGFAEKGYFTYVLSSDGDLRGGKDISLTELSGGEAMNVVAPHAKAVITVSDQKKATVMEILKSYDNRTDCAVEINETADTGGGKSKIGIKITGVSAHASTPELGRNAIASLVNMLAEIEFDNCDLNTVLSGLSDLVGNDYTGEGLGIKCEDNTGALTNVIGLISFEDGVIKAVNNVRSPISFKVEDLMKTVKENAAACGLGFEMLNYLPHLYIDPESRNVNILMEIYKEYTGDNKSLPKAVGSGSYARILENRFIPFGPVMPEEDMLFHKPNENISCERLLLLSKIYAEALYRFANI